MTRHQAVCIASIQHLPASIATSAPDVDHMETLPIIINRVQVMQGIIEPDIMQQWPNVSWEGNNILSGSPPQGLSLQEDVGHQT